MSERIFGAPPTREFRGKIYRLWFVGNNADGIDGPNHKLIRYYGGKCKEVKITNGEYAGWFALYYRGININKIPKRSFHDTKLYE
jgi:hypothetical protein